MINRGENSEAQLPRLSFLDIGYWGHQNIAMYVFQPLQMPKVASEACSRHMTAQDECKDVMGRIYDENPEYWPYGLNLDGHDGGCWLIREASTLKSAGFVGWQERQEWLKNRFVKVGYYSIGILPEFRNCGMAKKAVRTLLNMKAGSVDVVRAFIVPGNGKSEQLAKSLGVPVVRDA